MALQPTEPGTHGSRPLLYQPSYWRTMVITADVMLLYQSGYYLVWCYVKGPFCAVVRGCQPYYDINNKYCRNLSKKNNPNLIKRAV
jgi:hypothetical protein